MPIEPHKILLVVVNYNQAHEIGNFLAELAPYWHPQQTLLVDDGSTDSSLEHIKNSQLPFIRHSKNQGVGAAIRSGILYARKEGYEAVLIMSSNGKMKPIEISRVTAPILEGTADYVTGSRFINGGLSPGLSLFRLISIPVFSLISSILLNRRFTDITCGYRCYKINFLFEGDCDIEQEWLSRYELEYYIHYWACHKGLRIFERPVTIRYSHLERKRHSKIRPLIDWWSMIRPLLYLRLGVRK